MGDADIVAEHQFHQVAYAMLALASVFILVRIGIQLWIRRRPEPPDCLIYLAYIFFLAMSTCYLIIMPKIYRLGGVTDQKIPPWPTMVTDITLSVRMMFVTTALFWFTLWFVKLSFLALYKKLMTGLPKMYMRIWWAVCIFCVMSLLGCVLSYMTSCAHFGASLEGQTCSGKRSVRGELASLYLAYALDVLSDLMIMFLPMRLVWKLQRAWGQKFGVLALFASGFFIIAFATIRVIQIGVKVNDSGFPSPTWLALWSMIESSVAICVGCCPAFAVLYRSFNGTRTPHVSYNTKGYVRHDRDGSKSIRTLPDDVEMNAKMDRAKTSKKGPYCHDADNSSLEELATDFKSIRVTTVLHQDHR